MKKKRAISEHERRLRLLKSALVNVQGASALWEDYLAACGYIDDAPDRREIARRLHEMETALQKIVAEELGKPDGAN